MKKNLLIWVIVMALAVCLTLSACSKSGSPDPGKQAPNPSSQAQPEAAAPSGGGQEPKAQQSSSEMSVAVAVGDGKGASAPLPGSYPSDVFPLYPDSYILNVVELDGGFTIAAFSKDDFKGVAAFYKALLKNASVTLETDSDSGFTSFGTLGGYTYNFDTGASSELAGYDSSITILLMPNK